MSRTVTRMVEFSPKILREHETWQEVSAIKFVDLGDGKVEIQVRGPYYDRLPSPPVGIGEIDWWIRGDRYSIGRWDASRDCFPVMREDKQVAEIKGPMVAALLEVLTKAVRS